MMSVFLPRVKFPCSTSLTVMDSVSLVYFLFTTTATDINTNIFIDQDPLCVRRNSIDILFYPASSEYFINNY